MLSATLKSQEVDVSQITQEKIYEDRISALPNDLLVHILLFVPTKYAVATMILSKRWQTIWTEVPRLEYDDIKRFNNGENGSVWLFLDKSLHLHKAPILERLCIRLGESCPIDADVTKWVANAVDRSVRKLVFDLRWSAKPTSMPQSLYTCETLVELNLFRKILLDVPSSVCLPSLTNLILCGVVYKDETSVVRLLSSCPVLKALHVMRFSQLEDDNVKKYSVNVPSLEEFSYSNDRPLSHGNDLADMGQSLVIDCPALTYLYIYDSSGDSCSIGNMPNINRASIFMFWYPDKMFLRYLSSATSLSLTLPPGLVMSCRPDNFTHLVDLSISPCASDWMIQLMLMLKSNPKLKSLTISNVYKNIPLLWNKPDHVPQCLAVHLEVFKWISYQGGKEEKEFVAYILANSTFLKEADFPLMGCQSEEERKKMRKELNSLFKISPSCLLTSY